jgi:hypothetical protein
LLLDVKLPTGPRPGHQSPALHRAATLKSVADRVELGADDADGARLPHGPDLAFHAARQGDRDVWLKPVAGAVSHQAASGPHPVTIAHHERVNVHAVTKSHPV